MTKNRDILIFLLICGFLAATARGADREEGRVRLLSTTYPIDQVTRMLVQETEAFEVLALTTPASGCAHGHALTPSQLRRMAAADVVLINGLSMPGHLDQVRTGLQRAPELIAATEGLTELIVEGHDHADHDPQGCRAHANPHVGGSPRLASQMARALAAALAKRAPHAADQLRANANAFTARMTALDRDLRAVGAEATGRSVIAEQDVFDYLLRSAGIACAADLPGHAGRRPSAAEIRRLIRTAEARRVAAVLVSKPSETAQLLANELGIPIVELHALESGPADDRGGHYEQMMQLNLARLQALFGARAQ